MPLARFDNRSHGDPLEAIERVASSDAFQASRFAGKVYGDEPILRTGRALERAQAASKPFASIYQLARRADLKFAPVAQVFYEQAKLLEDVTDDAPTDVEFASYYPTYQAMNERQLRAYLSWRTALRTGTLLKAPVGFAFVHIYELLMGVGTTSGEAAFAELMGFWRQWRLGPGEQGVLDRYLRIWMRDYVVYHGLDKGLLADELFKADDPDAPGVVYRAVAELRRAERRVLEGGALEGEDAERTFAAMSDAASFRLATSRFYKDYPQDTVAVVCGVFSRLVQHCDRRRKVGFVDGLFGKQGTSRYQMFGNAVFYEQAAHADFEYRLGDEEVFTCQKGQWSHTVPCADEGRSAELGRYMRAVDYELRRVYGHPKQVRAYKVPKYVEGFVSKEVEARHTWHEAHTVAPLQLDRSKLRGIRSAAAVTREALLVDEEREEEVAARPVSMGVDPTRPAAAVGPATSGMKEMHASVGEQEACAAVAMWKAPAADLELESAASAMEGGARTANPYGLTHGEAAFLRAALGGDAAAMRAAVGTGMTSLMVDAVNEKLFDLVGDTVLEYDGEEPVLVEDYREDVEGIFQ